MASSQKPTEQTLTESDLHYRSWFENAPLPMWVYDVDDLSFLAINEAAIRKYGWSRDEFLRMTIKDIRPAEDIPQLRRTIASPEHNLTKMSAGRHRTKDGTILIVEVYSQSGSWGGKPAKIVQVRDVTELSRAQLRLEERTAFLDALIEHSPVAVIAVDMEERVILCNPAFERLFLYRQSELMGSKACQAITPSDLAQEALELTRRVLDGQTVHVATRRKKKDGSEIDVELHGVPLVVVGKEVGLYWLYQDITERKQAEAALRDVSTRLLRSQEDERRKISRDLHDTIGQTLTALSGNLAAVCSVGEMLPQRERKSLSESLALAENTSRQIRTLSYLLYPPMLDEEGLASALELYIEGFAARSRIQVDLHIPAEIRFPQEFETTLFRIVQESLTNILRHSATTKAEIRMSLVDDGIILEVRDYGKGIAPAIFEKVRSGSTGVGVGIASMRERLRQLGGRLEIDSDSRGTTIRTHLPLKESL